MYFHYMTEAEQFTPAEDCQTKDMCGKLGQCFSAQTLFSLKNYIEGQQEYWHTGRIDASLVRLRNVVRHVKCCSHPQLEQVFKSIPELSQLKPEDVLFRAKKTPNIT